MKKRKYFIVIILFIFIMVIICLLFKDRFELIQLKNQSNHLLSKLYELDEGRYIYEDGTIYVDGGLFYNDNFYINGNGQIEIDKYKNVRFFINTDKYYIMKTYCGNIVIDNGYIDGFDSFDVKIIKNNNVVSFTSLVDDLEYKISTKDDFKGDWIKNKGHGNITIKTYNEGVNYIWFKDGNGNISDVYEFSVDCLKTNKANYRDDVFYCSGSSVVLDNMEWNVIKDNNSKISLMLSNPLEEKMSHYDSETKYYWETSKINNYLNNTFINMLSDNTKNRLIDTKICEDYYVKCNDEVCIGNSEEYIESNSFVCNTYSSSMVRILSYDEYNLIYNKIDNYNNGYWLINSFEDGKGSIVDSDNKVFILEDFTNSNYVKPVITMSK